MCANLPLALDQLIIRLANQAMLPLGVADEELALTSQFEADGLRVLICSEKYSTTSEWYCSTYWDVCRWIEESWMPHW